MPSKRNSIGEGRVVTLVRKRHHGRTTSTTVAVLGSPNVGKSSLVNYLLGTDLSAVCDRAQTTRNFYHCIFTIDNHEIILVDTPGFHKSNREFNKRLNQQAIDGAKGADINLVLIDLTLEISKQLLSIKEACPQGKSWVVFTKSDRIKFAEKLPLEEVIHKAQEILPPLEKTFFTVSSKTGDGMHILVGAICDSAVEGRHLYRGEISNRSERFFVSEYVREQAFHLLKEELPYECAVIIEGFEDFRERGRRKSLAGRISATIVVNRPSQRAIVIGGQGRMIKEIGTRSRKKIEALLGGQIHLNLHVKVVQRWFKNNAILEELGLPRAENSDRVWKKR